MTEQYKSYKIYALAECPYCNRLVQALMDQKKTFYVEFLDGNKKKLDEMKKKYKQKTVPIVILREHSESLIGGCDDTLDLLQQELNEMNNMNDYTVTKPWGHEIRFAQNEKYLGKVLYIAKGHRLSRQYHKIKDETIMVYEGSLTLELGIPGTESFESRILNYGDTYRIMPGVIHRFCAPQDRPVVLIEVSTSELDDVERLEDDYKRI
jgi:mannose-6-phosphate isomerase-like protein (cupin superfamily)|tara:strand:+ start:645 stop:1268 length:624 start_codon:yes stop_codon:yes gene_type:complete